MTGATAAYRRRLREDTQQAGSLGARRHATSSLNGCEGSGFKGCIRCEAEYARRQVSDLFGKCAGARGTTVSASAAASPRHPSQLRTCS